MLLEYNFFQKKKIQFHKILSILVLFSLKFLVNQTESDFVNDSFHSFFLFIW